MNKSEIIRSNFYIAVHVFVVKDEKVLLGKRQNTGWFDGFYDSIGGHLEAGEKLKTAAARELQEEAGLNVTENNLSLFHITQYTGAKDYIYFMFLADNWLGQPKLKEPDYISDLAFFPIRDLPDNITPYAKKALQDLASDSINLSFFGG